MRPVKLRRVDDDQISNSDSSGDEMPGLLNRSKLESHRRQNDTDSDSSTDSGSIPPLFDRDSSLDEFSRATRLEGHSMSCWLDE